MAGDFGPLHERQCLLQRSKHTWVDGRPLLDLAPKRNITHPVTLNEAETQIYYGLRGSALEAYKKYNLNELGYASVLQAITRLRQACCDPRLIKKPTATQSESLDDPYSDNDIDVEDSLVLPLGVENLLDALPEAPSSKIAKLLEVLSELRRGSPKARFLVFSEFRQYLQTIQTYLSRDGYSVELHHGKLTSDARQEVVDKFQDPASKIDGLLITLKSGGQGLTLIQANHAFMMTPHWNPAAEAQAQDCIHRMGQTQEVFIHHIPVPRFGLLGKIYDTVEASVSIMQEKKQLWADGAAGRLIGTENGQQSSAIFDNPKRSTLADLMMGSMGST